LSLRARGLASATALAPAGDRTRRPTSDEEEPVLVETTDDEQLIPRIAALDIGKAELVACVRLPSETNPGKRLQEVTTYATMTRALLTMSDRFRCLGVTRVVMEATSDYWKPVFYLLEAAGFEVWLVNAKDVKHLPGRAMLKALIAGQRDPKTLAQMARTRMRTKIPVLEEAFTGHFTDHHAYLLSKMVARVEAIEADISDLDRTIEEAIAPFADAAQRLDEIPGVGLIAAHTIIAEIGLDMNRFPTAGHLCSWAKFTPITKESAGKKKGKNSTGHGNRYLARVLGEAAVAASKTPTFLGERYRRIARRRGKKKAVVAVGRSILTIVWHLLSDPDARFHDLGTDFYDTRIKPDRKKRNHVRQLEALGYQVILEPAV
jgi:transposase